MMARIRWVQQRLENWAAWSRAQDSGALGYPKQAAFVRLAPSGTAWGSTIPTDSLDAALTDQAVQSLRFTHGHLWLTLKVHYVEGLEIFKVAKQLAVAQSTVKLRLETADAKLAEWFQTREQAQRDARQHIKNSFTS